MARDVGSFARLCAVMLGLAACGGQPPGSIHGSIRGVTYAIADAVSAYTLNTTGPFAGNYSTIWLTSHPDMCSELQRGVLPPDLDGVTIELGVGGLMSVDAPFNPGAFPIIAGTTPTPPMGPFALVTANVSDDTCANIAADAASATSGTVTITAVTNSQAFAGHFDIVMDSGDHVTGEFSPEACHALDTAGLGTTLACQP